MRLRLLVALVAACGVLLTTTTLAAGASMPQIIIDRDPNPRNGPTALLSVVGDSLTYGSASSYDMRTRRSPWRSTLRAAGTPPPPLPRWIGRGRPKPTSS